MMNEIYRNRDWLYDQYINKQKSAEAIARETGFCGATIDAWLHKFNVPTRDMSLSVYLTKKNDVDLSPWIYSFICGELLGDGCVVWTGSKVRRSASYSHSSKYMQYLEWLSSVFSSHGLEQSGRLSTHERIWNGHRCITNLYATRAYPALGDLRRRFYPNWKKIVPRDLILDPLMTRQFYIGDGCLQIRQEKPTVGLSTNAFDKQSIDILREQLFINNIDSTHQRGANTIYMGVKSGQKFLDYILPCPKEIENIYGYKWNCNQQK